MRCCTRWIWFGAMVPVIAGAAIVAMVGCGDKGGSGTSGGDGSGSGTGTSGGSGGSKGAKGMKIEDRATLTGQVKLKNFKDNDVQKDLADLDKKQLDAMQAKETFKPCHGAGVPEADQKDQTWVFNGDGGLANVVVWLSAPEKQYFQLGKDDLDADKAGWEKEKVLDQPYCAFHPHVMVLFESYKDENGKSKKTGQKVTVKNSATTDHNTKIGEIFNSLLPAGKSDEMIPLDPTEKNYTLNCNIHSWMNGYIWSFDHPFAAVTDKDGKFTIKNVPAGSEVRLNVWHEKAGKVKNGEKITIKKDETKDLGTIDVEYKK
jgi:hypothetical protein